MTTEGLKIAAWCGWVLASVALLSTGATGAGSLAILAAGVGLGLLTQVPPLNRPLTAIWDCMVGAIYDGQRFLTRRLGR